jgi:C4-dicarboxylate transporter, DctM subunit
MSVGNLIPPSGIVILTFGILEELHPGSIALSSWMIAAYGIGLWFFVQRWLTLWGFCKYYDVQPIPEEERPRFRQSFKLGWPALILPALIFIPLFMDAQMQNWIKGRIGEAGAEAFSFSVLMFTPGMAAAYALWIGRKAMSSGKINRSALNDMFRHSLNRVVPISVTIYMAYATSQVFVELGMEDAVRDWFVSLGLTTTVLIVVLPLFFMLLGMILPGSSQIAILGGATIASFAALGGDPVLFAALLPAMTGALEGMTPPLALGMYVAMGIAGSGFKETAKLTIIWVACHVLLSMLLLTGMLPVLGL